MHLVIDGYNLIHQSPELFAAHDRGGGREALAAALKLYRQKRGHRFTVVFDGGPEGGPSRATLSGVPVIYSGAEVSADQVIVELARQAGEGLTVITDDRQLGEYCRQRGAEVIPARTFAARLMETAQGGKGGGEEEGEGWDFSTRKKGPSRREPKARRRQARRLEKL